MAVSEDLLIKVQIDTSSGTVAVKDLTVSLKDLNKAAGETEGASGDLGKSFSKAAASAIGMNQAVELAQKAYKALVGPIEDSIKAFVESEKVQTTLIYTLKALGIQADAAFADLSDFATNLQKTTVHSDETTLSLASMAKVMGLSNVQTKQVIKASADMAAVLGTDVNQAFNELIGQFSGVAGRSAKYIVGLKDLNETQLKMGKGIELVTKQFGGFAEVQAKTLAGAMAQSKVAFEDIYEESGKVLSQFFDLPAAVTSTKNTFVAISKAVAEFGGHLNTLKTEMQKIPWDTVVEGATKLGVAFGAVLLAINGPAIIAALGTIAGSLTAVAIPAALVAIKFTLIAAAVLGVVIAVETVVANIKDLDPLIALIGGAFVNMFERVVRGFASIGIAGLSAIESVLEPLATVSKTAEAGLTKVRAGMIALGNVAEEADKKVDEVGKSMGEISKNVKTGATLDLMVKGAEALKKAFGETAVEAENLKKPFDDVSRATLEALKPTKEQLALISQIRIENTALSNQIKAMSDGRGAQILAETELLKQQSAEKLRQLEVDGKLAGSAGKQIIAGLKDQLALQIAKLQPLKEQLDTVKGIVAANLALEVQAAAAGRTELENLDAQYSLLVAQTSEKLRQLEVDGMLGGEVGQKIIDGLVKQLELQQEINDEKKFQAAAATVSKMNPVAEGVGTAALEAGKAFNKTVIPAFNDVFGANIAKFSSTAIAAFAIGAGKFLDSFEGFMEGTANVVGSGITKAAEGLDAIFGTAFADGASEVSDAFVSAAGVVGGLFDTFVSVLKKVFDPKFVQGIADALGSLVEELPQLLTAAFNALADAFTKIIDKLPQIIDNLMTSLSGILDKLFSMAPKLIDSLAEALTKFLDRLPELTQKLFSALPGIIDKLFSKLPDIITSLFKAIPQIITQFIQAIPGIIKGIVDHIPEIVMALVSGIIGAMGEIVAALIDFILGGGLEKIVGAILRMIPKLVVAFVKGVINGLVRAFGAIFGGIKAPAFIQDMGDLPKKFEKGIKDLSKGVAKEASKVFKVLDMEGEAAAIKRLGDAKNMPDMIEAAADVVGKAISGLWEKLLSALRKVWEWVRDSILMPIFNALKAVWQWVYDHIIGPIISAIRAVWQWVYDSILKPIIDGIRAIWQWVYTNLLSPFITAIQTVWQWVYTNVIQPFVTSMTASWTAMQAAWKWVYDNLLSPFITALTATWNFIYTSVLKPFIDGLSTTWQYVYKTFIEPIKNLISDSWSGIKDFFTNIFKGKIDEAFKGVLDSLSKIGGKIWDGLKSGLEGTKDYFQKIGGSIWSGLSDGLSGAAKTFTGIGTKMWNGLKDGLGDVGATIKAQLDKINPLNLFTKMFNFSDTSGEGTVERTLGIKIPYANFATGGLVPGSALISGDSALNDRIVALLSPGEAVIPRSKMNNPAIRALVDSIISGQFSPPGYFLGIGGSSGGIGIGNPFDGGNPLGPVFDGLSSAAKSAFGPIASTVGSILDPTQLKSLGDAITSGKVDLKKSPLGDIAKAGSVALGDAKKIAEAAGNTVSGIGAATLKASQKAVNDAIKGAKTAADQVKMLSKYADPRYLWNLAKEKAFGSVLDGMANHLPFHSGGLVPSFANGGDVPALLQPGEFVMQRSATNRLGLSALTGMNQGQGGGNVTYHIDLGGVRIDASSQSLDETYVRSKLIPSIKEELKKASLRGDFLMSDRGLRTTG